MSEEENKTNSYVVLKPGVHMGGKELQVHSTVELTEKQATHLINKVKLKVDYDESTSGVSVEVKKLKTDIGKSEKTVVDLTTKLEASEANVLELSTLLEGDEAAAELVLVKKKLNLYESFVTKITGEYELGTAPKDLEKELKKVK